MFPKEIWQIIFDELSLRDLLVAKLISREMRKLVEIVIAAKFDAACKKNAIGRHFKTKLILLHEYIDKIAALDLEEIIICACNSAYLPQNDMIARAISAKIHRWQINNFMFCFYNEGIGNILPDNIRLIIRFIVERYGDGQIIEYLEFYRCWNEDANIKLSFQILETIDAVAAFKKRLAQSNNSISIYILKRMQLYIDSRIA